MQDGKFGMRMQAFRFVYLYFLCFQRMRIQAVKCGYLYLLLAKEDDANLKFGYLHLLWFVEDKDASHKVWLLIFKYVRKR